MSSGIEKEWDRLTSSKERRLAEEIDAMAAQGLSPIQIASRLNLRISVVWNYLRARSPEALKDNQHLS
jgi:hypothetical protein